jgi:hypothetical protein
MVSYFFSADLIGSSQTQNFHSMGSDRNSQVLQVDFKTQ